MIHIHRQSATNKAIRPSPSSPPGAPHRRGSPPWRPRGAAAPPPPLSPLRRQKEREKYKARRNTYDIVTISNTMITSTSYIPSPHHGSVPEAWDFCTPTECSNYPRTMGRLSGVKPNYGSSRSANDEFGTAENGGQLRRALPGAAGARGPGEGALGEHAKGARGQGESGRVGASRDNAGVLCGYILSPTLPTTFLFGLSLVSILRWCPLGTSSPFLSADHPCSGLFLLCFIPVIALRHPPHFLSPCFPPAAAPAVLVIHIDAGQHIAFDLLLK